jgi:riboflavin biosynthesis pyrimidine reductase
VLVFTTADPDPKRVKEIVAQAGQVIVAGERSVEGGALVQSLAGLGYRTIYSAAGPRILHLLISGGVLDRLYLTQANRILGGQPYASIMEGPLLDLPASLKFHHIYLDHHALDGSGQLFVAYDRV